MAVVLLVIVLLVTWIQRRLVPDEKVDLVMTDHHRAGRRALAATGEVHCRLVVA